MNVLLNTVHSYMSKSHDEEIYVEPFNSQYERMVNLLTYGNVLAVLDEDYENSSQIGGAYLLVDPRARINRDQLLTNVKELPLDTPLCACILEEHIEHWTTVDNTSSSINRLIRPSLKQSVPAVLSIDNILMVPSQSRASKLYHLLSYFSQKTTIPVLISEAMLNGDSQVVDRVDDVLQIFMATSIDCLILNDILLLKEHYKSY